MKNLYLFSISIFMRNLGLGGFFLLFNLYVNNLNMSINFLGTFLATGNIAMSIFSYLSGILIDKYNKLTTLKLSILLSGLMFMSQLIITNEYLLYVISFFYGVGFIFLLNLENVISAKFNAISKVNVFNLEKGIGLAALSLGSIIAGKIADITNYSYQSILLCFALCYILSIIPTYFIKFNFEKSENESTEKNRKGHLSFKAIISIFLIFLFLGNTVMLRPYYNLYLEGRFHLNLATIGTVLALFQFSSVLINYLNLKKYTNELKYICILISLLVIGYLGVMKVENEILHIILLVCITSLYNLLNPRLVSYILDKYPQNIHGRVSGVLNTSYNLGDSLSTYVGGILILTKNYYLLFILLISSYFIIALLLLIFYYKKDLRSTELYKFEKFLEKYIFPEETKIQINKQKILNTFMDKYDDIPYIKLKKNPLRSNFIIATWYMSIYQNISSEINFELLVENSFEKYITSNFFKIFQLKVLSKYFFSRLNVKSIQKIASLEKGDSRYLGFQSKFIPKSKYYDFGINTYSCPLYNFFKENEVLDALIYICRLDFIRSKYLRSNLKRKKTLAKGDEYCDFRWKK